MVLIWSGTREAIIGAPNDEALPGHRLYEHGLDGLRWTGVVEHSERIARLEPGNRSTRDTIPGGSGDCATTSCR